MMGNRTLGRRFAGWMRALGILCVAGGLLAAGCSSSTSGTNGRPAAIGSPSVVPSSSPTGTASAGPSALGCRVGVSWDEWAYVEFWDEPAVKQVLDRAGVTLMETDSKGSVDEQEVDIDAFVAAGVDVIIVRRLLDGTESAAVKRATAAGIPVVVEHNLLENPGVLWVGYDAAEAGRMEARAVLAARPKGNYAILDGSPGNRYGEELRRGVGEVLQPALESGAIKIVGETTTSNQDVRNAKAKMDAILAENHRRIDAVIVNDDYAAIGAILSLDEAGLAGKVAVGGTMHMSTRDGYGLRNVARGMQVVDVWQDFSRLGTVAAEAAVQLCRDRDIAKLPGTTRVTSPRGNQLTSILLPPQPITQDNLQVALDAGWIEKDLLCGDYPGAWDPDSEATPITMNPARAAGVCR